MYTLCVKRLLPIKLIYKSISSLIYLVCVCDIYVLSCSFKYGRFIMFVNFIGGESVRFSWTFLPDWFLDELDNKPT